MEFRKAAPKHKAPLLIASLLSLLALTGDGGAQGSESLEVQLQEVVAGHREPEPVSPTPLPAVPSLRAFRLQQSLLHNKDGAPSFIENDFQSEVVETAGPYDPFPLASSRIVMEGRVLAVRSYLSEDESSIYTEFAVEVLRVFRSPENDPLLLVPGTRVVLERRGGLLILEDGRLIRHTIEGQGFPQKASTYLFFLNPSPYSLVPVIDRAILTLQGRLFPVDWPYGNEPSLAMLPFTGATTETALRTARTLDAARQKEVR